MKLRHKIGAAVAQVLVGGFIAVVEAWRYARATQHRYPSDF